MAEARDAAAKHQFDVLISDGGLGDGDGIGLKAKYGMSGILISGSIDDGAAVEAEGFNFLPKPVSLKLLLNALESL